MPGVLPEDRVPGQRKWFLQSGSTSAGAFPPEEGNFGLVGSACAGSGDLIAAERFHFVEVSVYFFLSTA